MPSSRESPDCRSIATRWMRSPASAPHILSAEMEALLAQAARDGQRAERIYRDAQLRRPQAAHGARRAGRRGAIDAGQLRRAFPGEPRPRRARATPSRRCLAPISAYRNTFARDARARRSSATSSSRAPANTTSRSRPRSTRNNIPVSVYDNLITTVNANLPVLHRYLRLRKRLLGLDELHMYDLYVPMVQEVEYKVTYRRGAGAGGARARAARRGLRRRR